MTPKQYKKRRIDQWGDIDIVAPRDAIVEIFSSVADGRPARVFTLYGDELLRTSVSLYNDDTTPFVRCEILSETVGEWYKVHWLSPLVAAWCRPAREAADNGWAEYIKSGKRDADRKRSTGAKEKRIRKAIASGLCKYVRFGVVPKSGRSWNARDHKYEHGVSVYRALVVGGKAFIIVPEDAVSTMFISSSGRPLYEVGGRPVGFGADGEVVLDNAVAIKRLRTFELVMPDEAPKMCDELEP